MQDLTLALWQTPQPASTAEALQRLDAACMQARAQGAALLVTPEMFLTGYAIGADRVAALAQAAEGPLAQAVADIARRYRIAVVYGYPENNPAGHPFNAAQFIDADGARRMNYRKTHLYGAMDRAQFSAGDHRSQTFEWQGWRLGLLICYDVEFPEPVCDLALQGADAVLVPTANMGPFDDVQRTQLPARALDNRLFVAYANACGTEGGLDYNGLSTVCAPDGHVLARAPATGEALLLAVLSRSARDSAQTTSPLPDRRTDLFGTTTRPQP